MKPIITATELQEIFHQENLVILDARTGKEARENYLQNHIKGSRFIDLDKDLAEIPPLKANLALNYEHAKSKYTAEIVAVDSWDSFDDSAKEQELAGYALVNLKYTNQLHKNFAITLGMDNLFDKVYNSTNTYQDVTYMDAAIAGSERVLLNDPGRYGYVNLKYSF